MNSVIENLVTRRSVRAFKDEQISDEQLEAILQAGTYAPSGRNRQSSIMVVVQDQETIALLSKINREIMQSDSDPFYGAPTVVVVLADATVPTYLQDGTLVMGNLMNAAHGVGVDSCWIHRAKETFLTPEGIKLLEKWQIDSRYVGIGNCVLGYHAGEYPSASKRKENYIYRV